MTKRTKVHLERGFDLISSIPVSGENVEVMAKAKTEFRAAYAAVNELEKAVADLKQKEETVDD